MNFPLSRPAIVVLTLLVMTGCAGATRRAQPAAPVEPLTIQVLDFDSAPLPGAVITVRHAKGQVEGVTNASGIVRFRCPAVTTVDLEATMTGFVTMALAEVPAHGALRLIMTADNEVDEVTVKTVHRVFGGPPAEERCEPCCIVEEPVPDQP